MESHRKNLNPSYKYLWLNVIILIFDAFLLSTIYIGIRLADIMATKTNLLLIPLMMITLLLPIASLLSIKIDNKKNEGILPKFRIISNKSFIFTAVIFEMLAIVLIILNLN